jgi:hypothetical protein
MEMTRAMVTELGLSQLDHDRLFDALIARADTVNEAV